MGTNPVRVMASGAIDVNHRDEIYDGKVKPLVDCKTHSCWRNYPAWFPSEQHARVLIVCL